MVKKVVTVSMALLVVAIGITILAWPAWRRSCAKAAVVDAANVMARGGSDTGGLGGTKCPVIATDLRNGYLVQTVTDVPMPMFTTWWKVVLKAKNGAEYEILVVPKKGGGMFFPVCKYRPPIPDRGAAQPGVER